MEKTAIAKLRNKERHVSHEPHYLEAVRDKFAAHALQGLCTKYPPHEAAKEAYLYADEMMEARLK